MRRNWRAFIGRIAGWIALSSFLPIFLAVLIQCFLRSFGLGFRKEVLLTISWSFVILAPWFFLTSGWFLWTSASRLAPLVLIYNFLDIVVPLLGSFLKDSWWVAAPWGRIHVAVGRAASFPFRCCCICCGRILRVCLRLPWINAIELSALRWLPLILWFESLFLLLWSWIRIISLHFCWFALLDDHFPSSILII